MLVIILRKMNDKCFKKENTDLYKSIDSIDSLYDIIIVCYLYLILYIFFLIVS